MEKILNNPGLQHLAEKVFWNLDVADLKICAQINGSCKQILEKPIFWLRKFGHLSKESQEEWIKIIQSIKNFDYEKIIIMHSYLQWKSKNNVEEAELPCSWFMKFRSLPEENQKDWIKAIESEKNSDKENAIISYLLWSLKNEDLVDLPCYTSPDVQDDFRKRIREICMKWRNWETSDEDTKIVKILAPLTGNSNAPNNNGKTPISVAKNAEIRRFLESFNTSKKCKVGPSTKPSKKKQAKKF